MTLAAQLAAGQTAAEKAIARDGAGRESRGRRVARGEGGDRESLADKTANDPALVGRDGGLKAAATPEATAAAAELTKQAQKSLSLVQAIAAAGTRQSAALRPWLRPPPPRTRPRSGRGPPARPRRPHACLDRPRRDYNRAASGESAADKALADGSGRPSAAEQRLSRP